MTRIAPLGSWSSPPPRRAARVSGGRVALSRLPAADSHSDPQAEAGVAGETTAITLTLAADYGQDLRALAKRIRSEVTDRVRV
jgi:hypothetical protein